MRRRTSIRRPEPLITLAEVDQGIAENIDLGYIERVGTDEHGSILYQLTDAGRRRAEEVIAVVGCVDCERCTWNPGPDCGLPEHRHCNVCGHCLGRHSIQDDTRFAVTS